MKIKEFLEAVFYCCDLRENQVSLKDEIYNDCLERIDELVSNGHSYDSAEELIINGLGDIESFREELNLRVKKKSVRNIYSVVLLYFHIVVNFIILSYSIGYYIPKSNFLYLDTTFISNYSINRDIYQVIIIIIILLSLLNIFVLISFFTKTKNFEELKKQRVMMIILGILTFPMGLLMTISAFIINFKDMNILDMTNFSFFEKHKKGIKVLVRSIFSLYAIFASIVIITFTINFLLIEEYVDDEYYFVEFSHHVSEKGININGEIKYYLSNYDIENISISSQVYIHRANFEEADEVKIYYSIDSEKICDNDIDYYLSKKTHIQCGLNNVKNFSLITDESNLELVVYYNSESENITSKRIRISDLSVVDETVKIIKKRWIWQ